MDVAVMLAGPQTGDELRSLREWLLDEDGLRGRVSLQEALPLPGTMGPVPDALLVTLVGAAATRFATTLIHWLRTRVSDVSVTVTPGPDGPAIDLNAVNIRNLDAEAIRRQIEDLVQGLPGSAASKVPEPPPEAPG